MSTGVLTFRSKRSRYDGLEYVRRWPSEWIYAFNYYRRQEMFKRGFYVLAPFWADTNYNLDKGSQVYYQMYKKKRARKDARCVL